MSIPGRSRSWRLGRKLCALSQDTRCISAASTEMVPALCPSLCSFMAFKLKLKPKSNACVFVHITSRLLKGPDNFKQFTVELINLCTIFDVERERVSFKNSALETGI